MTDRTHIEVLAHGPYEVTGNLPLRPKDIVHSRDNEPIAWRTSAEIEVDGTYYLCRCGQSSNKPYCDGSHAFELFNGTETATTGAGPEDEIHEGTDITVHKYAERCVHSGFCANAATNWFEMVARTDDTSVCTQLISMIEHCPSGALAYEIDGEIIEPDLTKAVAPVPDGPLYVSGGVEILRADRETVPTSNRVTLCRCGGSSNKPLCDGTHVEIGFRG